MKHKGPMFAPEGVDGAGSTAPAGSDQAAPVDAQSVLYPEAVTEQPDALQVDAKPDATKVDEWKEFEPDASKTDEENAAAKAEHDAKKPAAPAAEDTVPEDGVYALTLPDGMEVDEVLLGALSPAMKDAGLTVKQANTLAAAFAKQRLTEVENWGKTVSDWVTTAKKDPEIGGANWDASVVNAQKVISQYGTPGLKEYLNASGAGNHPEVIRLMAKVGAVISEDKPTNQNQGGQAADALTVLYPDDKPKG